jgi:hypothetical protein
MSAKGPLIRQHVLDLANAPAPTGRRELKAVVRQHGVDAIRHALDQPSKEIRREAWRRAFV